MNRAKQPSLLGRIAVHLKMLSMEQLVRATAEQGRRPEKNLGEIFVELGFLDQKQLARLIQAQKQVVAGPGMQSMDDALFAHLKAERILPRDAYLKATDKARFEPLLGG